uniref:Uncharacterized protein n=1 Tax=Parascaris univalens TaxID=6257 RepID=A0A914ZJB2_PARUN
MKLYLLDDVTRDFTIVKYVKKNQCTCTCKCIPDSLIEQRKSEQSEVILAQREHPAEEVKAASKESEVADFSGEINGKESAAAASVRESIQFEQTTTLPQQANSTSITGFDENSTRQESYERTTSASDDDYNITTDAEIATTTTLEIHLSNTSAEYRESTTTQPSAIITNTSTGSVEMTMRTSEAITTIKDETILSSTDIPEDKSSIVDINHTNETVESEFIQNQTNAFEWNNNFENIAESAAAWNASNGVLEIVESVANGSLKLTNELSTTLIPEESQLSNAHTSTTSDSNDAIVVSTTTATLDSSSISEENVDRTAQNLVSDANTNMSSEIGATTKAYAENNGSREISSSTANPQVSGFVIEPTSIPSDSINMTASAEKISETLIEEDSSILSSNATNEIVEVVETIQQPIEYPQISENTTATTHHSALETSPTTDEIRTTNEQSLTTKGSQKSTTTGSDDGSSEEETDDESTEETTEPDVTTTASENYSTEKNALPLLESPNRINSFKEEEDLNTTLESEENMKTASRLLTTRGHLIPSKAVKDNKTAIKESEANEKDTDNEGVATEEQSVEHIPKLNRKIYKDKYGRIVFRVLTPEKETYKSEGNMSDALRANKKIGTYENAESDGRKQTDIRDDNGKDFQKESSLNWNITEQETIINSESESHISESNEHHKKVPATTKAVHGKDETSTKGAKVFNANESSPKEDADENEMSHMFKIQQGSDSQQMRNATIIEQHEGTSSNESTNDKHIVSTNKKTTLGDEETLSGERSSETSQRTTKKTRKPTEDAREASRNSEEVAALGAEAIESEIKGGSIKQEKLKTAAGSGESFLIETKGDEAFASKAIENDGNERIRQGWREALERLRQKLRAHREQNKEKKIVVNVEESHTNDDDKYSNEATKGSRDESDDDDDDGKEEKHLYLVQVIRDEAEADHLLGASENKNQPTSSSSAEFEKGGRSENAPRISEERTKESIQNLSDKNEKEITSQVTRNSADEAPNLPKKSRENMTKLKAATLPIGENRTEGDATLKMTKLTETKAAESGKFDGSTLSLSKKTGEGNGSPAALVADDRDSLASSTVHSHSDSGISDSTEATTDELQARATTVVKKEQKIKERENGNDAEEHADNERKTKVESNEETEESSTQETIKEDSENLTAKKQLETDETKLDKNEQKSIPEFEFSIDGPSDGGLKEGTSIAVDRRPDEIISPNGDEEITHENICRGAPVNAKLLRKKIEEERNIAILKEEEMERFKEEEAIRMKEQAERAQFLAQEERLLEMELNASNEEEEQQIREERKRLEQAILHNICSLN